MSSQKGNVSRTRAQKHKNGTVFKNTKYDTSQRTKNMLSVGQDGLCARCKETIEWKLKYKKYKPLTQPATCTRCHQKTVKKAYYTVCQPCATSLDVCAKCGKKADIVSEYAPDEEIQAKEQSEMEQDIKQLSERERRTLNRLKAQGRLPEGVPTKRDSTHCDAGVDGGDDGEDVSDDGDEEEEESGNMDEKYLEEKVDAQTLFD